MSLFVIHEGKGGHVSRVETWEPLVAGNEEAVLKVDAWTSLPAGGSAMKQLFVSIV